MKRWQNSFIDPEASIERAIQIIDKSGLQLVMVVDTEHRLLGVITDGDVRRALLQHIPLTEPVTAIMQCSPVTASPELSENELRKRMLHHVIDQLPLVDSDGKVVGLQTLQHLSKPQELDNTVILMAGGQGTRLRPLTEACPKPMLRVGVKPLLELIIDNFIEHGFHNFYISVNYLAKVVKDYFEDGSEWGINIHYIEENEPLGTAGSLGLIPKNDLQLPAIVMNGDILTQVDFTALLKFHREHKSSATMGVREWKYRVPYGVLEADNQKIKRIVEKPLQHFFVNAGIYVLDHEAFSRISGEDYLDMPDLFSQLIEDNKTTTMFPIREYWLDVGQHQDFEQANRDIFEARF
ncbi:nucleotidyltransferase family protein [Dongshaea marina]|uniref:nucleotidyltransferase family protein n=1 Tax=Dongshaea marina TaxID=2047966 RepID=UPI000D3EC34F|nr:nucleotidyltransferase family protein [Dongshaea marina]